MNILIGISGGIAAYKCLTLIRLLKKEGYNIECIMTEHAKNFITPLSIQALTGNLVRSELFDLNAEQSMGHIELARWADIYIIVPCTANTLAQLAHGHCDNLLTTTYLATDAEVMICPAMNQNMFNHPVTQRSLNIISQDNVYIMPPNEGEQACGDVGAGRLPEPEEIVNYMKQHKDLKIHKTLNQTTHPKNNKTEVEENKQNQTTSQIQFLYKHIVITAGPTVEALDPVRFISNHSSGKMGYALAQTYLEKGYRVDLITGPTNISVPTHPNCNVIKVKSAQSMLEACQSTVLPTSIFIACAAVCDYRVKTYSAQKIKKQNNSSEMTLELIKNPDILATIAHSVNRPRLCIGFAAETEHLIKNAKTKLTKKNVDLIVLNDVSRKDIGFNSNENEVTFITKKENIAVPKMSKHKLAQQIAIFTENFYEESL